MNTSFCPEPEPADHCWPDLLASIYPLVEEVVRFVARRHRLTPDDATELGSLVRYKLVEDDYHVLRSFQNRSSMKTYLTTVVSRVWLDWQVTRRGKWRPSVAAKRLGDTAVRLEQLLVRDRLTHRAASGARSKSDLPSVQPDLPDAEGFDRSGASQPRQCRRWT